MYRAVAEAERALQQEPAPAPSGRPVLEGSAAEAAETPRILLEDATPSELLAETLPASPAGEARLAEVQPPQALAILLDERLEDHEGAADTALAAPDDELEIAGPALTAPAVETDATPEMKVIAFPKLSPYRPADDELAESFSARAAQAVNGNAMPRILDADAELLVAPPLPPALGGIALDAAPRRVNLADDEIEVPVSAAPLPWRCLAEAVDLAFAATATALFGGTAFFIATRSAQALGHSLTIPNGKFAFALSAGTFVLVWFAYKTIALVLTGTTPGLRAMGLELRHFRGCSVDRNLRARRAGASLLSFLPAGLGYLWCFLDDDFLGWHDRITQTYLAVGGEKPEPVIGLD